jgi:hypothetical protein
MSASTIAIENRLARSLGSISRNRDVRRASSASEPVWECVRMRRLLTASELADTIYRPRAKIHRDFSREIARARRWHSARVG